MLEEFKGWRYLFHATLAPNFPGEESVTYFFSKALVVLATP